MLVNLDWFFICFYTQLLILSAPWITLRCRRFFLWVFSSHSQYLLSNCLYDRTYRSSEFQFKVSLFGPFLQSRFYRLILFIISIFSSYFLRVRKNTHLEIPHTSHHPFDNKKNRDKMKTCFVSLTSYYIIHSAARLLNKK